MLSNVSWGQYLLGLIIIVLLYYVVIGGRYFRKEIRGFFQPKVPNPKKPAETNNSVSSEETTAFEFLEDVLRDLKYAVLEKFPRPANKQKLQDKIVERLSDYDGLAKPAFRYAINNYIIVNAKEICGVVFSEDELNTAWEKTLLR